jgi:hypothetical protein
VAGPADESLDTDELRWHFEQFANTSKPRAPLYAALSTIVARERDLYGLLRHAPPTQRLPVLLFACVHELVIGHPQHPLATWYPNLTTTPRSPTDRALASTFASFVVLHHERLVQLLSTRTTQTNEVGRCGSFLPALGLLGDEVGAIGLLDVGASGGLNLLLDRYEYRYRGPGTTERTVGGPSTVTITVDVTGAVPVPVAIPTIAARCGIDQRPIDVTDEDEARWLEACVWPDQADRFHRLVSAIEIARANPPEILAGDAVASLGPAIERIGRHAHPVVTNSWVLNYLTSDDRIAYLAELERIGTGRDLSWVYAEAPALIPELPNGPDPNSAHRTVLSMVRWRGGERSVAHLATVHPHGFWMHWR